MRAFWHGAVWAVVLAATAPAGAQSPFSPAILVNDDAITYFELDQRTRMLELFRSPGDIAETAREGLIEDRLKIQELRRAGLQLSEESLLAQMEEFAGRANMPLDQFLVVLEQNGVSEETLRDFVEVGVSWRDYVRERFGSRVNVTEAEVDQALGAAGGSATAIEVLLSEIIIPAPAPEADRAFALAQDIAQTTSTAAFEAAARQYSALPSRERGGRLDWLPLSNYPEQLRPVILDLAPGEVTPPIRIDGGVALFQMRDVREVAAPPAEIALIDYSVFLAADAADAAQAIGRVDTCDDFYGVARGLPEDRLIRAEVAPAEIPQDIALALAALDTDEIATLPAVGGVRVLMLCSRTPTAALGADRDAVRNQLRNQRLQAYANALLADLRAQAVIVTP